MKDLTWPCSDKKPFHFGIVGTMTSRNSGGMRWLDDDVNLPCVDAILLVLEFLSPPIDLN